MNDRIDVLAVMDAAEARMEASGAPRYAERVKSARAAIAELIEAVVFVRDNVQSDSPEMWARLDAAIARVGGAPA